jgi:hypothetical protein
MIKNLFGLLLISVFVISCGNSSNTKKAEAAAEDIQFAALIENPAQFENKEITVTGKVVHVCTNSGKKMFIVGDDPDTRLFITAGDDIPKFPMELLGSEISVTGTFALAQPGDKMGEGEGEGEMHESEGEEVHEAEGTEVNEAEEAEMEHTEGADTASAEDCETEAAVAKQAALSNYVLHYKSHIVK